MLYAKQPNASTFVDGMAAWAGAYAARGWHVLPCWWPGMHQPCACPASECGSPAKHPHGGLAPNGLKDATADSATIANWWRATPPANVAIRTGAVSGLVVLDVDGLEGEASLRALLESNGRAGRLSALWVRTGSGGWHAYMAHPGQPIANSAGKLGARLDVRGDGGYVIAPPSLHVSGRRYEWLKAPSPILPPMPAWLVELLTVTQPAPAPVRRAARAQGGAYGLAALRAEAARVSLTAAGGRNDALFRSAARLGELVGAGALREADVTAALLDAARSAGLPEREAEATVRSGLTHGVAQPRQEAR